MLFGLGLTASPALAGSHAGSWGTIFGNGSSCALGRASTNDTTDRAGALAANFQGCSAANSRKSVPPYYLGAQAVVFKASNGAVCGVSGVAWNTTTASSRDASTPRTSYANGCDAPGVFIGAANTYRDSDAGVIHKLDRIAGAYYFDSSLT